MKTYSLYCVYSALFSGIIAYPGSFANLLDLGQEAVEKAKAFSRSSSISSSLSSVSASNSMEGSRALEQGWRLLPSSAISEVDFAGDANTFVKYEHQLRVHGYRLTDDGLAIYPANSFKSVGDYIVPVDWPVTDHSKSLLPPGYIKTALGDVIPQAHFLEGDRLPSGFFKTASGSVLPDDWIQSELAIIPKGYATSSSAILPPGWKDGGTNAFAVPSEWKTIVKDGQTVTIPPTRHFPNNGKFPKTWIKDEALKKYRHPDWTVHHGIAFPPGIAWTHRFPQPSFPSDVLHEVTTSSNRKILIPKGWSLTDDKLIPAGMNVHVVSTSTGSKILLPKGWTLAHNDQVIPHGMKMTSSGKIIPKSWIFDEESKRIVPETFPFEIVGLGKHGAMNPFAEDIMTKVKNLFPGVSQSVLDSLSARLAPDGFSLLLPGYKKFPSGDIAPSSWQLTKRNTLLPPAFKETDQGDILRSSDRKTGIGSVWGPETYVKDGFVKGWETQNYFIAPWKSNLKNWESENVWAPVGYTHYTPTKTLFAKGWGFNQQLNRARPPGTKWLSLKGSENPILVPDTEYTFIPSKQDLEKMVASMEKTK